MAVSITGADPWLIERLRQWGDRTAIIWHGERWSYDRLCDAIDDRRHELSDHAVHPGSTLAIFGDCTPNVCAMLVAAILNRCIVVPIASAPRSAHQAMLGIAEVEWRADFIEATWRIDRHGQPPAHPLLRELIARRAPGLVLFSSGSTGESKASVLDMDKLLAKFRGDRIAARTLVFLTIDHIGGINTLFHVLCHGGTIVVPGDRGADTVCAAIDAHRVELLPTTPTFLKMLLISGATSRHHLGSLKTITYGTEPMPASTLAALRDALPWVRLKQTYGLTELGILPTQSRDSGSLWLRLGAAGFEHKIVDNRLWLRSAAAMLGYLNADSPFDADGWFNTQDLVEVDGDYVRILGRASELINVGGEKVYPTEVENVLLQMDNVQDVTVSGRSNPLTGAVVAARFSLAQPEDPAAFRRRVQTFCQSRLERFKVPMFIEIVTDPQHTARFKKRRAPTPA